METFEQLQRVLPDFLLKFAIAILCGGVIGLEREIKGKAAGFRTNILICLGSTLYMILSEFVTVRGLNVSFDPTRIAAQVVTGIGFIGAGTIIQSRGSITGLTSAATIWVVAGIGLCIGIGYPITAIIFTMLVLGTLVVLGKFENRLLGKCTYRDIHITFDANGGRKKVEIADLLLEHDVKSNMYEISDAEKGKCALHLRYCDKHPAHNRFMTDLWKMTGIAEVELQDLERHDQ
jgi:putative Mg2+ transporter-C (MgtC) family protein